VNLDINQGQWLRLGRPLIIDLFTEPRTTPAASEPYPPLSTHFSAGSSISAAEETLRAARLCESRGDLLGAADELRTGIGFLPLNSSIMLKAAELWAEIRNAGLQTADDKALDGDVILAAQALEVQATIATENVGHLSRLVFDARHWRDIHAP
jgi:predicted nucleic acid-binding protein